MAVNINGTGSITGLSSISSPTISGGSLPAGTASTPGITFSGDSNTGIYSPGADKVAITTSGTERLIVDDTGKVGIGAASPGSALEINAAAATSPFIAKINTTEAARIDSSGRLLVGTSTARANFNNTTHSGLFQVEGASSSGGATGRFVAQIFGSSANADPMHIFARHRSDSVGGMTAVSSGDRLGSINFQGSDGTEFVAAAEIIAEVDGTPGANDMPGRLVFSTTADGASSPTERMRINANGSVLFNKTSSSIGTPGVYLDCVNVSGSHFTQSNGAPASINRITTDGNLLEFYQDSTIEGTISVSGTTVSYNGAHLSRWSQLPGGAEREEILRGTVLSNIDEMCGWGEEDNEQLNRMKVSDVEGDRNVSGVFQAWDDDDDTYTDDFYCAMTGDFIIRIAEGVTVQRGDLLMSAGDGTAKPQDDDIIRSKTVAKVTSTHVTCTYDDGSYCVPCVLMAC